jgi:hypothetical protein
MDTVPESLSPTVTLQLASEGGFGEEPCHIPVAVCLGAACRAPNSNMLHFCYMDQCPCCLCKMYKGKQNVNLHLVLDTLQ